MNEHDTTPPDDVDRALGMAYGEGTSGDSGGVLRQLEQSTGMRFRTTLLPLAGEGVDAPTNADLEEALQPADGHFEFLRELARGGVGIVYHGRDRDLRRDVAIKVLKPELADQQQILARFIEEAQVCGQLAHPGIVPVYGLTLLGDGQVSIAMKLVRGATLEDVLDSVEDRAADLPRLLGLFEQLAATVGYAHARRVIHRDLKPANVMVGAFGELQVMDWGFAKVLGRPGGGGESELSDVVTVRTATDVAQSIVGAVMGTPGYMSPEQARGQVETLDERSDVFALGSILCRILTGEPVYTGSPMVRLRMAMQGEVEPSRERLAACGADRPLVELVERCTALEPQQRPRDAAAVAEAIRAYREAVQQRTEEAELERARARARETEAKQRAHWERRARRQTLGIAATAAVGVLAALVVFFVVRNQELQRAHAAVAAAESALDEADDHVAAGRLLAALGAARRGAEQLSSQPDHPTRRRALGAEQRIQARMEQEARAHRLEEEDALIRARLAAVPRVGTPGVDAAVRRQAIREAFSAAGLDVVDQEPAASATALRVRGPETRDALVAALHAWCVLEEGTMRALLLEVADAADPNETRGRLRHALTETDRTALLGLGAELAEEVDPPLLTLDLAALAIDTLEEDPEVLGTLRHLRDRQPQSKELHLALARRLAGQGPRARMEAWRSRHAAVTIDPTLDDVWVSLGEMKLAQGRPDEADAIWRAAITHGPRSDLPHLRLARHLADGERDEEARAVLDARLAWHEAGGEAEHDARRRTLEHWLTAPTLDDLRAPDRGPAWEALWQRVRDLHERSGRGSPR